MEDKTLEELKVMAYDRGRMIARMQQELQQINIEILQREQAAVTGVAAVKAE